MCNIHEWKPTIAIVGSTQPCFGTNSPMPAIDCFAVTNCKFFGRIYDLLNCRKCAKQDSRRLCVFPSA